MVLKVILTDADVAMTSAVASVWKGTQHLFCLWHVNKNLVKKCAGALSDDDRTRMLRSFRSVAYAVNAEVRCLVACASDAFPLKTLRLLRQLFDPNMAKHGLAYCNPPPLRVFPGLRIQQGSDGADFCGKEVREIRRQPIQVSACRLTQTYSPRSSHFEVSLVWKHLPLFSLCDVNIIVNRTQTLSARNILDDDI